jgi:hypothetical protein
MPPDFGQRRSARLPDMPQPKRSNHVALLVMGTLAVGGGAYALMPHETCQPVTPGATPPGMAAPATPTTCTTRSSSSSGGSGSSGYSRSRWSFFGGSSSSGSSSAGMAESSSHVTRGGFGSFGHMFSGGG